MCTLLKTNISPNQYTLWEHPVSTDLQNYEFSVASVQLFSESKAEGITCLIPCDKMRDVVAGDTMKMHLQSTLPYVNYSYYQNATGAYTQWIKTSPFAKSN